MIKKQSVIHLKLKLFASSNRAFKLQRWLERLGLFVKPAMVFKLEVATGCEVLSIGSK